MFEELMFPLFSRSILIGLVFGLVHFIVVNPLWYKQSKNYLRFIGFNLIFVLVGLPVIYYCFRNSFHFVSYMSSLHTNSLFSIVAFLVCVITSLVLFGLFKFPDFRNKIEKAYPQISSISFLFDSQLYWFILNAYLVSAYSVNSLHWFLSVLLGFIMALSISNLRYHLRG